MSFQTLEKKPAKSSKPWKTVKVGDSLRLINGRAFKPTEWADSGTPIVRIQNLNKPDAAFNYYNGDLPEKFLLNNGDLLFAWSGTPGTSFGAHIWNGGKAWLNQHIFKVLFDAADWDKRFLRLAINQNLEEYIRAAHGAAGLAHITKGVFERSELPFPPLDEQRRIVAEIEKQFTRLEAGVSALKRVQANLKRYRAAVLKAACSGELVPTEAVLARARGQKSEDGCLENLTAKERKEHKKDHFETGEQLLKRILEERRKNWLESNRQSKIKNRQYREPSAPDTANLPPLPDGWTWVMSDALFSFITSGSRGWAKYYSETGPLFLRIGNLDHENIRLDLSELQHVKPPTGAEGVRTVVQANDILISITADVGMVGLVPSELGQAYINQHVALARPLPDISPTYVAYYLCASEGGWGYLKKLQRGATKVGLGLDDIRAVPVPLPPLAEQVRIVAEVERRLSVVEELEAVVFANLQRATRLRQSVLQKAFSGGLIGHAAACPSAPSPCRGS
ncbi:MAG: restriction endonuclease subunit S [Pontiellaceae bacterium]|jgi:type I restriction enzyme S subunit|nr:restriction endonuclease subunit S [Pontiellaceae bacterium]